MKTYVLFSPLFFLIFFCFCFILYLLGLSSSIAPPSGNFVLYTFLCLALFALGTMLAGNVRERSVGMVLRSAKGLWLLYWISVSFFIFEHAAFYSRFGALPVFLENFEELRFQFMFNGYVHLMAMMNYIFLLMIFCCKLGRGSG